MKTQAWWFLVALVVTSGSFAQCLKYAPEVVTLTGVVHLKTFYGPPGYGEDPAHDRKERQALLTLDQPLCVAKGLDDGLEEPEADQHEVTLVPLGAHPNLSSFRGKHVRVRGTFFHAITGHHHTALLLDVKNPSDIEALAQ